jgi:quercetin 2,3-dioxygenase
MDLVLPEGHTALIVLQQGAATINVQSLQAVELAELERTGTEVHIAPSAAARMLVLTGQPIAEPVCDAER